MATHNPGGLTWGITSQRTGTEYGTVKESVENIWLVMLHKAEEQLVKFAAAARAAKCDEARIEAAERYGSQIAGMLQAFAAATLRAVLERLANHEDAALVVESAWSDIVRATAPLVLRAAAAEPGSSTRGLAS